MLRHLLLIFLFYRWENQGTDKECAPNYRVCGTRIWVGSVLVPTPACDRYTTVQRQCESRGRSDNEPSQIHFLPLVFIKAHFETVTQVQRNCSISILIRMDQTFDGGLAKQRKSNIYVFARPPLHINLTPPSFFLFFDSLWLWNLLGFLQAGLSRKVLFPFAYLTNVQYLSGHGW